MLANGTRAQVAGIYRVAGCGCMLLAGVWRIPSLLMFTRMLSCVAHDFPRDVGNVMFQGVSWVVLLEAVSIYGQSPHIKIALSYLRLEVGTGIAYTLTDICGNN